MEIEYKKLHHNVYEIQLKGAYDIIMFGIDKYKKGFTEDSELKDIMIKELKSIYSNYSKKTNWLR